MSRLANLTRLAMLIAILLASAGANATDTPSAQTILAESNPSEWRTLDPAQTLYMQLAHDHLVVIELAPAWAPEHVANIKTLVQAHYFDGTSIYR
ncbi:MAG: peptidylprolyl isomerase, partial [Gammaproteobacteria bacterium]